jgi:hypothetical protein
LAINKITDLNIDFNVFEKLHAGFPAINCKHWSNQYLSFLTYEDLLGIHMKVSSKVPCLSLSSEVSKLGELVMDHNDTFILVTGSIRDENLTIFLKITSVELVI